VLQRHASTSGVISRRPLWGETTDMAESCWFMAQ
jgi:hypothetical protein